MPLVINMCCCLVVINTSEFGVKERFGKFSGFIPAGLNFVLWPCEEVVGKVSLRIQQLDCVLETKTKDNVFVQINISVQYQVEQEKIREAFYELQNRTSTMKAYIADTVRAGICELSLDQSFESKDKLAGEVKTHLSEVMSSYGLMIVKSLVTDIVPDIKVRNAMNEINASKRIKEAAYQKAEGEKIIKVKAAEANMESMYLSGVGVAKQRAAIMDGLKDSINAFSENNKGVDKQSVMDLLILNQYFDTLQEMGSNENMKVVFLSGESQPVRSGLLEANAASRYN